jgi:hypothetical protein
MAKRSKTYDLYSLERSEDFHHLLESLRDDTRGESLPITDPKIRRLIALVDYHGFSELSPNEVKLFKKEVLHRFDLKCLDCKEQMGWYEAYVSSWIDRDELCFECAYASYLGISV